MTENQKELIIEWLEHIAQMADSKKTVSGKVMKDSDALNEIKVLAKDSINYIKLHT